MIYLPVTGHSEEFVICSSFERIKIAKNYTTRQSIIKYNFRPFRLFVLLPYFRLLSRGLK